MNTERGGPPAPGPGVTAQGTNSENEMERNGTKQVPLEPTAAMIDQGAKRLVRWEDGCVVVPGKIRCAKCNFALVRTNLYMQSGTTGPGNNETEPCPNGCGPLWPVTWEQEAREAYAVVERYFDEAQALRRAVQDAYGRLWCVNAEPMAPVPLYPPAAAARDARAILLAMLTKEQQAEAISKAREALGHNAN